MSDTSSRTSPWSELAKSPRVWVGIAVAVLSFLFILQNREAATINLLNVKMTSPLWLTLTIIFLAGCATGFLLRGRK